MRFSVVDPPGLAIFSKALTKLINFIHLKYYIEKTLFRNV